MGGRTPFLLVALLASCCWAQTLVYTTGPDGQTSAYLLVINSTSTSASSLNLNSGASSSRSGSSASATSSPSTLETSTPKISMPTVPYSGQSLLVGTCTIPIYTALQYEDGHFIEVPLIGCSDDRPECCPSLSLTTPVATTSTANSASPVNSPSLTPTGVISMLSNAPLKVCPSDMVDLDPVCCPRGFTKWGQAILGNTPCASLLSTSYTVPTSVLQSITSSVGASIGSNSVLAAAATASVTVIVNQVFALGLPCADDKEEEDHELSTGAKAGIGVGVGLGALLIILLGLWFCGRIRRQKKKSETAYVPPPASQPPPMASKMGVISSGEQLNPHHHPNSNSAYMQRNTQWINSASLQDAGYGQGFVDGIKAATSPYQSPPQSPPPFYGAQRYSAPFLPAEAPTESLQYERRSNRAAELSASDTNTRSSVA